MSEESTRIKDEKWDPDLLEWKRQTLEELKDIIFRSARNFAIANSWLDKFETVGADVQVIYDEWTQGDIPHPRRDWEDLDL